MKRSAPHENVKCRTCFFWKRVRNCANTEENYHCGDYYPREMEGSGKNCGECTKFQTKGCPHRTKAVTTATNACEKFQGALPFFTNFKTYVLTDNDDQVSSSMTSMLALPYTFKIRMKSDYYPLLYGKLPFVDEADMIANKIDLSKEDLEKQSFLLLFNDKWVYMDALAPYIYSFSPSGRLVEQYPWADYDKQGLKMFFNQSTSSSVPKTELVTVIINPTRKEFERFSLDSSSLLNKLQEAL